MSEVPRSFRRESRLFLWIALLLILFLNFATLLFFRDAVSWGSAELERRAAEILRRSSAAPDAADALEHAAGEPDVLFAALYDRDGRRVRSSGHGLEAPAALPAGRPEPRRVRADWRKSPPMLFATLAVPAGFLAVALDPGAGGALRSYAGVLVLVVPAVSAVLVVLAGLYLRSLLGPYERLLAAAGPAPQALPGGAPGDERDFLIARFESTIAALSEKEKELQTLARAEKERADDLDIAAHTLARNLPTGLLSVDSDGRVIELNQAGSEILGLSRAARGEPSETVLAGIPELKNLVRTVLAEREAIARREIDWRHAGGEERVIGVTATPAEGADGRFLGVLALFSDVSEIRRLEARVALARHLADLGNVSAGAAHEFRNAAAAIDGFADLALRNPERAPEHLKAIRREAQEMSRVTNDFLLFARPEGFLPEAVSLAGVAESAAEETERAFPGVAVERSGELPEVAGSAVLLRRALVNLLRNGVEATPPERRREAGAIVLAGARGEGEILISVGDRGAGVQLSQREKIFLPFYSSKPEGIGFGLAIVARIAELHGGTVEVNPRPGGGSVFALRLPIPAPGSDQKPML